MNTTLLHVPISQLLQNRNMITVDSKLSVPSAFRILAKNNIYGAPVLDTENGEIHGFVDMIDIVALIVHIFDKQNLKHHHTTDDFYSLLEQVEKFDLTQVDKVTDLSKRNPMCPIKSTAPLLDALSLFVKTGAHRLPVIDDGKSIKNILTQSDVTHWIATHMDALGDFSKKSVRELGLGFKDVVSVTTDTPVLDGFRLMLEKKISGVAVVEKKDGTLFTNLSAKDIKLISQEALFTKLYKSTLEFVQDVRSRALKAYFPVVYVHPETTMEQLLEKFHVLRIHRVYIVDDFKKPIGVISLVDVINAIISEPSTRVLK